MLIEDANQEIREKAQQDEEAELLSAIHGVGYYSALLIKSEIGDIKRFFPGAIWLLMPGWCLRFILPAVKPEPARLPDRVLNG